LQKYAVLFQYETCDASLTTREAAWYIISVDSLCMSVRW